jgi:AcrR family transcriptional regulator
MSPRHLPLPSIDPADDAFAKSLTYLSPSLAARLSRSRATRRVVPQLRVPAYLPGKRPEDTTRLRLVVYRKNSLLTEKDDPECLDVAILGTVAQLPPSLTDSSLEDRQISRATQLAERRERVLAGMTAVFAKRGYQAATVGNLIAGAKISMGNFYKEFEGKEDCFLQVYDRVIARARERISAAVPSGADWEEQAIFGTRALVSYVAEEPISARIVLAEAQTSGPASLRRHGEVLAEAAAFLRRGRRFGSAAGKLPENAEDAAASGLLWLLQSRLTRGGIEDPEKVGEQVTQLVLEPYIGRERAERAARRGLGSTS